MSTLSFLPIVEMIDSQMQLAFHSAGDLAQQIITLSTGILALTITFTKDILKGVDNKQKTFLIISWLLYLFSIIFGIWTLMAITGTLSSARFQGPEKISIMTNIQLPAALQIITFVLGIINTIWYGASSVKKLTAQEK